MSTTTAATTPTTTTATPTTTLVNGSVRINFSIHREKYPKVFEALQKWQNNREVISNKICQGIEKQLQFEEQQEQQSQKEKNPS